MVTNPASDSLLNDPNKGALQKILRVWGSSLTWTIQRERAGRLVRGIQSFFAPSDFLSAWDQMHVFDGDDVAIGG